MGFITIKLGGGFKDFFHFYPYLGKIPILTNIFQMDWNHQLVKPSFGEICFFPTNLRWKVPAVSSPRFWKHEESVPVRPATPSTQTPRQVNLLSGRFRVRRFWGNPRKCFFQHVTMMGTHVSFIFRGYNPYIGGLKPSFFMVLGSKGMGQSANPPPLAYLPSWQISLWWGLIKRNQWFIAFYHDAIRISIVIVRS